MIKIKELSRARSIAEQCTGCNKCMTNCSMLKRHCESPKELFEEIASTGQVDRKLIYSCTGCDYCNHVCPVSLDIKEFCYEIKRQCVTDNAVPNKSGQLTVINFHKASIHPLFTYLDKKVKKGDVDTVFLPGCSLASAKPKMVKQVVNKMNVIEPVGLFIDCCGNPIYSVGDQERFDDNKKRIMGLLNAYGVKKVVTACGNCYKTFSVFYDIEVMDLWQYMDAHSEVFVPQAQRPTGDYSFILHDPCAHRKNNKTHESVRNIMDKMGIDVNEFHSGKGHTPCCGAGGMMELIMPDQAMQAQQQRVEDAEHHRIISYCQSCVDGFRKFENEGLHLLDLIFGTPEPVTKKSKPMQRWMNRLLLSNIIK